MTMENSGLKGLIANLFFYFIQKCSTFRTMKRGDTQALSTDDTLIFPIPYDLPPVPYRTCGKYITCILKYTTQCPNAC